MIINLLLLHQLILFFQCPVAPIPIFDRLFRDGVKRVQTRKQNSLQISHVSDVALAFRSVFGKCLLIQICRGII